MFALRSRNTLFKHLYLFSGNANVYMDESNLVSWSSIVEALLSAVRPEITRVFGTQQWTGTACCVSSAPHVAGLDGSLHWRDLCTLLASGILPGGPSLPRVDGYLFMDCVYLHATLSVTTIQGQMSCLLNYRLAEPCTSVDAILHDTNGETPRRVSAQHITCFLLGSNDFDCFTTRGWRYNYHSSASRPTLNESQKPRNRSRYLSSGSSGSGAFQL